MEWSGGVHCSTVQCSEVKTGVESNTIEHESRVGRVESFTATCKLAGHRTHGEPHVPQARRVPSGNSAGCRWKQILSLGLRIARIDPGPTLFRVLERNSEPIEPWPPNQIPRDPATRGTSTKNLHRTLVILSIRTLILPKQPSKDPFKDPFKKTLERKPFLYSRSVGPSSWISWKRGSAAAAFGCCARAPEGTSRTRTCENSGHSKGYYKS